MLSNYQSPSDFRIAYLKLTIDLLKQYGKVYLVRMLVINEILEIENELQLDFDIVMLDIAKKHQVHYINMMPENSLYDYKDGNHLDIPSGIQFSINLANKIKNY